MIIDLLALVGAAALFVGFVATLEAILDVFSRLETLEHRVSKLREKVEEDPR